MSKLILSFILLCSFSTSVQAQVQCGNGVTFEESITVETNDPSLLTLDLNGVGRKRVLFFNVFYAALYLENLSSDGDAIIASDDHKVGIIHATRNISREQLVEIFDDEFEKLCEDQCDELRPFHEQFISYLRDIQTDERIYLMSFPDRLEVEINQNEFFDPIESPDYARLLQKILYGPDASDMALKNGLLGKTKICR